MKNTAIHLDDNHKENTKMTVNGISYYRSVAYVSLLRADVRKALAVISGLRLWFYGYWGRGWVRWENRGEIEGKGRIVGLRREE
jgi:hypothetical protein